MGINTDKYPKLIERKGFGFFSCDGHKYESQFEITDYPQVTTIESFETNIGLSLISFSHDKLWKLDGILDNGVKVTGEGLFLIGSTETGNIYQPSHELKFISTADNGFSKCEIPLVGFYEGSINFFYDNWSISISNTIESETLLKQKSNFWNLQLEGHSLTLVNKVNSKRGFTELANNITLLLSLVTGGDVHFNRQLLYTNDILGQEIWRRKAGYYFGARRSIPVEEINNFLKNAIPIFENWDKDKKDTYFSIVSFINSSSYGFVENRLLGLCIAWEGLVNNWQKEKKATNVELRELKRRLNECIRTHELPTGYDKQLLMTRISEAFDYDRLYNSILTLLMRYKICPEKLHLDIKTLVELRNQIAHYGRLQKEYDVLRLVNLIFYNKVGLQVFLLKELGYDKEIEFKEEGNFKKNTQINEFYL